MICSNCNGGQVEWQGRLSDLTHTKCLDCGAINSQIIEQEPEDDVFNMPDFANNLLGVMQP